ncbi:MAG: hypothetical protein KDA78_04030 [Planctomycetaceae bacterium]|nr:hypothetical protein [Planctomycetaceae bacterium]
MFVLNRIGACAWILLLSSQIMAAPVQDDSQLITMIYQVADLVIPIPGQEHPQPKTADADATTLIKLLEECIPSGPTALESRYVFVKENLCLVARHTAEGHKEIQDLFSQIRRLRDVQVTLTFRIHALPPAKDYAALDLASPRILTPLEKHLFQHTSQDQLISFSAPKVTVFNGKMFRWELDQDQTAENAPHRIISTQAMISNDRKQIRLVFTVDEEIGATKEITVEDGQAIILDPISMKPSRSIQLGDKTILTHLDGSPTGPSFWNGWQTADGCRLVLTVVPQIITQEEEADLYLPVNVK